MDNNIIDTNIVLPRSLSISGADTHLYRIGLSLHPINGFKRSRFYNPLFVFIIISQAFIRELIYIRCSSVTDFEFHILIGNFGYLLGNSIIVNIGLLSVTTISLSSILINYHNSKNNVTPTHINIFKMMAGLMPSKCIGIYDKKICHKLLKSTRIMMKIGIIGEKMVFIGAFLIIILSHLPFISTTKLFIISIFHSFVWGITFHYINIILVWQLIYFYIIAYYLRLKLNDLNKCLLNIFGNNENININIIYMKTIMKRYNDIFLEINDYNLNYWSKFLGIFWLNISAIISTICYIEFFGNNTILYKTAIFPFIFLYSYLLLIIIHICAQIQYNTYKSYKLFNSIFYNIRPRSLIKLKVSNN